jgi:hypothetical protein
MRRTRRFIWTRVGARTAPKTVAIGRLLRSATERLIEGFLRYFFRPLSTSSFISRSVRHLAGMVPTSGMSMLPSTSTVYLPVRVGSL